MPRKKSDPTLRTAIGERIRRARHARGMEQVELAEAVGVRALGMWRYEKGRHMPTPERLDRIADALGVPARWLLRGGATPPGLPLDGEQPTKRAEPDPPLSREQQLDVLEEIDADPKLRLCWTMHMRDKGAFQRVTRVYMSRFFDVAERELAAGTTMEQAAELAGDYAFNAAVEAHLLSQTQPTKARRGAR